MTEYGTNPLTGARVRIVRDAPTPSSFWSYQAPPTPSYAAALAAGAVTEASMSESGFNSLSPGMRREIVRNAERRRLT